MGRGRRRQVSCKICWWLLTFTLMDLHWRSFGSLEQLRICHSIPNLCHRCLPLDHMLGIIAFSCHFYCMVSNLATAFSCLRSIWQRQKQALWIFLAMRKILKTNYEYQRLYLEYADSAPTAICIFVVNDLVFCMHNYYRKFIIYRNIEMCDYTESEQQFCHIMIFVKTILPMLFWGSRLLSHIAL